MLAQLFKDTFLNGKGLDQIIVQRRTFEINVLPKNDDEKWLNYWLRLIDALCIQSTELTPSSRDYFFADYVSWAIPSRGALEFIQHHVGDSLLFEVGCGTGIWALLLKELGVRVQATDLQPECRHVKVRYDDSIQYGEITDIPDMAVLFICWPTYQSEWATEMLKMFRGNRIIYIGEMEGCTASDSFFELLNTEWDLVAINYSHQCWDYYSDVLHVYDRREK